MKTRWPAARSCRRYFESLLSGYCGNLCSNLEQVWKLVHIGIAIIMKRIEWLIVWRKNEPAKQRAIWPRGGLHIDVCVSLLWKRVVPRSYNYYSFISYCYTKSRPLFKLKKFFPGYVLLLVSFLTSCGSRNTDRSGKKQPPWQFVEGKHKSFNNNLNNRSAEKLFLSQKGKCFQYCKIEMDLFQTFAKMLLLTVARVGQNIGYNFECGCCLKTAVVL